MSNTKNKPGIHIDYDVRRESDGHWYKMWQWYIVAKNGNIVGRSWRWYKRKGDAVKSIATAAMIFAPDAINNLYYDHSKKDSPLTNYLK